MSRAWKDFEREVAEYFGGVRRIRIDYGESIGDIIHPTLSIECKYGLQCPKKQKGSKFLDNAFEQARRYDPTKVPMVCMKRPRQVGFTIVTIKDHIYEFTDSGGNTETTGSAEFTRTEETSSLF